MSSKSKSQLRTENSNNFPNNNSQFITPEKLRGFNNDIIDSLVVSSDTGSFVTTSSFDDGTRIQTFTKADGTTYTNTISGGSQDTGSLLTTSSFDDGTRLMTFTKGDGTTYTNSIPGGNETGSLLTTASVVDATITFTKGDASTFNIEVDNVTSSLQTQDVFVNVKNTSGSPITKGLAVHAVGVTGENVNIELADSSNSANMPAIGLLEETLSNNASGRAIISGRIKNIDTSGLVAGASVYVNGSGTLTSTKPTGSDLIQNIGIAGKINATEGEIIVVGSGRSNDLPNITEGYLWVGDSNGVPQAISTGSLTATGSFVTLTTNQDITGRKTFRNNDVPNPIRMHDTSAIQFGGFDTTTISSTGGKNLTIKSDSGDGANSIKIKTTTDEVNDRIEFETYNFDVDANNIKLSGSVDIKDSVDIQGNVTSSISKQNVIVTPQTVTDNITISTNNNALVVGDTTFAGTVTIEGDSELSIFNTPELGELIETASISGQTLTFTKQDTSTFDVQIPAQSFDTGSFLTTSSYEIDSASFDSRIDGNASLTNNNTLTGNQIVSGSLTGVGGIEVGNLAAGSPAGNATLGVLGNIVLRSGSGIVTDGAFGNSVPFDSAVTFFNGIDMQGTDIGNSKFLDFNNQDPLPGNAPDGGRLAVSGSNLYFNNGTTWTQIN